MDPARFTRVDETTWRIEPQGAMRVPAIIYADENLIRDMDDKVCEQATNVAMLPGIVQACYAMPDAHWGYGFPIGGVAAFDAEEGGVVSAGGVGFDISCGVRTMLTGLKVADILPVQKALADSLFRQIPAGVGSTGAITLDEIEMDAMLAGGAYWAVELGWGEARDLDRIEEGGRIVGAEPAHVSERAKHRQRREMGTLGSGNHYLEVQAVAEVFDAKTAEVYELRQDDVVVTIHCGSRGLGHQIGTEFLKEMVVVAEASGITLPDRELACAPINSEVGRRYLGAMRAGINCALANREILGHFARRVFEHYFPDRDLSLLFDVSHNTCKVELHAVDGKRRPTGADRRQHGHWLLHSGGRDLSRAEGVFVRLPRRWPRHVAPRRAQAMERTQDPGRSGGARHSDQESVDARHRRGGTRRLQGRERGGAGGRARRARTPRGAAAPADLRQGLTQVPVDSGQCVYPAGGYPF
jgi:tRNA-splicing ligase RtcB (3'-phosphate/5'-hydroxy nucleic acid ligase)